MSSVTTILRKAGSYAWHVNHCHRCRQFDVSTPGARRCPLGAKKVHAEYMAKHTVKHRYKNTEELLLGIAQHDPFQNVADFYGHGKWPFNTPDVYYYEPFGPDDEPIKHTVTQGAATRFRLHVYAKHPTMPMPNASDALAEFMICHWAQFERQPGYGCK